MNAIHWFEAKQLDRVTNYSSRTECIKNVLDFDGELYYYCSFSEKIYPKGPENGRTVQMNCESVGSDFQAIWQKILKRQVYANFGQSSVTKTLPSPLKARIGKSGNE
ncbi:hypothetical protein [Parabacteroides distasonis]|uniref:hypothetical protein n=1 Tax=Parabacteroides distasonis TaxID=823 RepID=UPI0020795D77|nr:hypothetical protein [Parabacteroides distasonis]